jgi:aminopeptidase N
MKRLILTLTLISMLFASLWSQEDSHICKDLSNLIEMERRHGEQTISFRSSAFTDNYDLKYHRLEWNINPLHYYISGTVTSYFEPRETGFQEINFDLSSVLEVNEVTWHGQNLSFVLHAEDRLQIFLPQTLPVGQLDSVTVTYEGAPPQTGFGSFSQSTHSGTPIIWTLSEPYGAKDWWPCKQDLNDKIDSIDVIVRTPSPNRVASNGVLIKEQEAGADKIYHWRHRYPIPAYLIAIGVTNYSVYSDFVPVDGQDPIEVLNYVYPEALQNVQPQTSATIGIMQLFNELFGLYPFATEKYGHAQFGFGGGMEHQTMSFMGSWSHLLQAHELAHQWFGDKITCGSWEDIWLNEGFATYLEGMTYEFGLGPNTWPNWLAGKINHVTSQPDGSVWVPDTTSVNRIFSSRLSYSKGAMLLHMLRWKLGDEDFFQAVRNYIDDPALAYGYARTSDLKAHLEAQSGLDLTEFFDDWFYGQGYPSYQIEWWREGSDLKIKVNQTTSHSSVNFFEMPLPLLLEGNGVDSLAVIHHAFSGQIFNLQIPFEIVSVQFDPDLWIVSKDNIINEVTASHERDKLAAALEIYPNPVKGELTVSFDQWPELPKRIGLADASGREIRAWTVEGSAIRLDVNGLPPGAYVLKFDTAYGIISRHFVKQ